MPSTRSALLLPLALPRRSRFDRRHAMIGRIRPANVMIGHFGERTISVGSWADAVAYEDYQHADGVLEKGAIAIRASTGAISSITNNYTRLEALTWDTFIKRMSQDPYNYPASEIRSLVNMAWPILPTSVRDRLSKRSAPAQQASAPPPTLPPKTAPVHPSPAVPKSVAQPSKVGTYLMYGAAGLAALFIGARALKRRG